MAVSHTTDRPTPDFMKPPLDLTRNETARCDPWRVQRTRLTRVTYVGRTLRGPEWRGGFTRGEAARRERGIDRIGLKRQIARCQKTTPAGRFPLRAAAPPRSQEGRPQWPSPRRLCCDTNRASAPPRD